MYIKKDGAGNVLEIIINEAKQIGSAGNIKLNAGNSNTGLPPQMSDAWIDYVIQALRDQQGNLETLGNTLLSNRTKVKKTVTGVDKTTGEIVVLGLSNY